MKNALSFAVKAVVILSLSLSFGGVRAFACPGEKYELHQVALDSNGILTRSEHRESVVVVTDQIKVGHLDEITLNASPGMQDASVQLSVKLKAQKKDSKGIFSTTYLVREIWTSYWGRTSKTEKISAVTVASSYLGNGKYSHRKCGWVDVKELSSGPLQ